MYAKLGLIAGIGRPEQPGQSQPSFGQQQSGKPPVTGTILFSEFLLMMSYNIYFFIENQYGSQQPANVPSGGSSTSGYYPGFYKK